MAINATLTDELGKIARALTKTLEDAESETERDGWVELDAVLAEMDDIIAKYS